MPARFDDCEVKRATDKALLIYIPDLEESRWIPKSAVHDDSEVFDDEENSRGTLVIVDWFAEKEDLV